MGSTCWERDRDKIGKESLKMEHNINEQKDFNKLAMSKNEIITMGTSEQASHMEKHYKK